MCAYINCPSWLVTCCMCLICISLYASASIHWDCAIPMHKLLPRLYFPDCRPLMAGCGVAKDLLHGLRCSAWPFPQYCPQFWHGQIRKSPLKPAKGVCWSFTTMLGVNLQNQQGFRWWISWWFPTTSRKCGALILWILTSKFPHVNCNKCVL